jgi:hypothetical protein
MLVEGKFAKPVPFCVDVHRKALGARLGAPTMVIENIYHLARVPQILLLLANHFVRLLPPNQKVILTVQGHIPLPSMREPFVQVRVDDLSLIPIVMEFMLQQFGLHLSST